MSVNPEYIEQLVLDEIAGVITPEDSATLKEILAQEPEALVIRNDLYEQYANHPALDTLPETLPVDMVWDGIRKRKKSYVFIRTAVSIAASALIIVGSFVLFSPNTKKAPLAQHDISPNNIQLQLPNGQTVTLGNTQQQVQLGNLTLNNQQKQLSYTTTANYSNQQATLSVPPGKDYTITLSDGTTIQLNSATKLQFPFNFDGNTREITVNGEAYLNIAPNPGKPFIVHLPHSTIQVLGTEFNINTYDSGHVNVSLVKGALKLHTAQDSILLHPGYAVNYQQGKELHETTFDAEYVLSWRNGVYSFDYATLADISKVIYRWYGYSIVIDNPATAKSRFIAYINRKQPVTYFLDNLKFTGQFDYYFDRDSVLHMK